jgi:RimJ/RimL family protein N-acetyltransferase
MLEDDLIYLRKLEASDLDRTWEWIHDPDIYNAIGIYVPVSTTSQKLWFDKLDKSHSDIVFAICLKKDDIHIGNVSLGLIDYRHRNARVSIFVADIEQRGVSIGTRAMKLLIHYAFDFLNLHRLYCKTTAGNERILSFYKKLGFQIEGQLRQHEYLEGKYVDKVMLGIIKD